MQHMSDRDRALARSLCEDFMMDWRPGLRPIEVVSRLVEQRWPSVRSEARQQLCDILVVLFQPLMLRNPVMTDDLQERCVALVAVWMGQQPAERRFNGSADRSECPGTGPCRDA